MSDAYIKSVDRGSIAEEMGLKRGDCIVKIGDTIISDVLDYKFATADDVLMVEVRKADGDTEMIEVETDYEDLGIVFENSLMDAPKSCRNKCIFCFIDQLPKGMRETMYFKDDDARLSFLQGNYITLTNLSNTDIDRIIRMRISPVNVSVHASEPEIRCMMLGNRHAGNVLDIMRRLADNHITMNCQIVLCKGVNDGANLDRTISDLAAMHPYVNSVSVVPVGLTAYRDGLYPLEAYDETLSLAVIERVEAWQKKLLGANGSRIVYLADEFYLLAKKELPQADEYQGFPQVENGVGLIASMRDEFDSAIKLCGDISAQRHISVATGELAYGFIKGLCCEIEGEFPGLRADVYAIKNNFFGGGVTVSGLVCGGDIIEQLQGKPLGEELFIPSSMLRDGEDIFLDDITLEALQKRLDVKVTPVHSDGFEFLEKLLGVEI